MTLRIWDLASDSRVMSLGWKALGYEPLGEGHAPPSVMVINALVVGTEIVLEAAGLLDGDEEGLDFEGARRRVLRRLGLLEQPSASDIDPERYRLLEELERLVRSDQNKASGLVPSVLAVLKELDGLDLGEKARIGTLNGEIHYFRRRD